MIGTIIGNLRITDKIGQGGMGVVYLAEHVTLQKKFAVKCLFPALTEDPNFRERFNLEAHNQALLDHPNIVQATDFFEQDGQFFLVMEYVSGRTLDAVIEDKGKLHEKEALTLFKAVLSGLDFAHGKAIIHRDIKPSNVIVDESGRARIMDFGIAILAGEERLTSAGSNIGSPWYMSPESITRPQDIDHRSDVYSAGIMLYEMLTGGLPFDGSTEFEVQNQQVNTPVPDPRKNNPEISSQLSKIILRALAKDPDERFAGCAEFLQRIEAYEASLIRRPVPGWIKILGFGLSAVTLASIAIALYISQTKIEDKQGESAYILIQGASEKALITCREFVALSVKLKNIKIAESVGEVGLTDAYKKRIEEHASNIREGVSQYNDLLSQLGAIDSTRVYEKFNAYSEFLTRKKSYDQINITRFVRLHFQQQATNLGAQAMCKSCRENFNKSLHCESFAGIL